MTDIVLLVVALFVILLAAELFTNGIEWFGHKVGLGEGAVGSVLAAVGTALPETMIPVIAILFATSESSAHVGVGAILGAPFMLSTLAMFVTGIGVLVFARRRASGITMTVDTGVLSHDIRYFFVGYSIAIAVAFLPLEPAWPKWVAAAILLVLYAWYVKTHFSGPAAGHSGVELAPLRFRRVDVGAHRRTPDADPRLWIVSTQVLVALGLIIVGAFLFVDAVEHVAQTVGVDEALLALIIAPIATELPEKFNSILWVRQGKDTLAMGNITGAMVFQSMIPTVIALLFAADSWVIEPGSYIAFASAGIAFVSTAVIFIPMARRGRPTGRHLLTGGIFYLGYVIIVVGALLDLY
jgi:cation:H+ antiporter